MREVEAFKDFLKLKGAKNETIKGYEVALKTFEPFAKGKKYSELTEDDILNWIKKIEEYGSAHTRHDYKRRVKTFLRWIYQREGKPVPDFIKYIKATKPKGLGCEVLTQEEVRRMVEAAETQRDRALIHVLYDSGVRVGELVSMRVKDVEFDQYGAVVRVRGKTGERRVRLIDSVPDLQLWINMHPGKDNPEAPLWPGRGGKPIGIVRVEHMTRRYAKRAGISKRVHPHMLRHSRATHLAAMGLTEAQLREFFGWTKNSEIPSVYVHLSGRDVDRALLRIHGIEPCEGRERPLEPRNCPRCGFRNPSGSKFCSHCSMALEPKAVLRIEELYKRADELMAFLLEEFTRRAPAILEQILVEKGLTREIGRLVEEGISNKLDGAGEGI